MEENTQKRTRNDLAQAIEKRNRVIVRTSLIGIAANLLLVAFKATIGFLSNSIAVILDAVNNLSDALSSVITIIGAKLANRKPDKKHPLGHGRIEYISAMIVSAIVLYAGLTALVESVKKIITPEEADYSVTSLIIIAAAIVVKLILGRFVKAQGEKVNSGSLIASGSDAVFDAILSASVLASAILFLLTGISLEAYVGVVISIFIIKSGIEMMTDTLSDILGRRADPEVTNRIKELLNEAPEVRGAFDLVLYNYGPNRNYGSVHLELPDTMTVDQVDQLSRRLQERVYLETGVILTGVGVYSYNTSDNESARMRNRIFEQVMSHDWALQFHGFYVDSEEKELRFDVVMSFDVDHAEALKTLYDEIGSLYPDYHLQITADVDVTD
ncbi:MAG: cation diffusion facilitator family transporter [Clostridia bacterium]|nr:cation diffusion facilitator family transporter [Clostridia bacterium]